MKNQIDIYLKGIQKFQTYEIKIESSPKSEKSRVKQIKYWQICNLFREAKKEQKKRESF